MNAIVNTRLDINKLLTQYAQSTETEYAGSGDHNPPWLGG